jgi:predicted protein tyrosine phosphatase
MIVRVSNLMCVAADAADWKPDTIVSLIDPDTDLPDFKDIVPGVRNLVVHMDDCCLPWEMWSPKVQDVQDVFDFCKQSKHTIVHCHGGVSRSTAAALGLLVRDGMAVDAAVNMVVVDSPNMSPNRLILQHIDRILNMNGTFVSDVQSAVSRLDKTLILWCNKCREHFRDGDNCTGRHWL